MPIPEEVQEQEPEAVASSESEDAQELVSSSESNDL